MRLGGDEDDPRGGRQEPLQLHQQVELAEEVHLEARLHLVLRQRPGEAENGCVQDHYVQFSRNVRLICLHEYLLTKVAR